MSEGLNYTEHPTKLEDLLQRAPDEVVEVLGTDSVLDIEAAHHFLTWLDGLVTAPNPFLSRDTGEADFSFMKSRHRDWLEDTGVLHESLKEFRHKVFLKRSLAWALHRRLDDRAKEAVDHCFKVSKKVASNLEGVKDHIEVTVGEIAQDQDKSLDPELVHDYIDYLAVNARSLPSPATFKAIKKIFNAARTPGTAKNTAALRFVETTEKHRQIVNEIGYATYNILKQGLCYEEAKYALVLVKTADEAKIRLEQHRHRLGSQNMTALLGAERYLIDKADFATGILRRIEPEITHDPTLKAALQRLRTSPIAKAAAGRQRHEQARQRQAELAQASPFNVQVTEARDIVRGGRRLGNGKKAEAQAIADGLHNLFSDQPSRRRLLQPEERGLIMAILADRLEPFLETLERVQNHGHDAAVQAVEQARPEVVKLLREFDVLHHAHNLQTILMPITNRQLLSRVLPLQAISKIDARVAQLLEVSDQN